MHYTLEWKEIAIRLLVAAVLGGFVGWERETKDGAAGFRTHMLVCTGSALIMIVSVFGFNDVVGRPGITLDPSRVAAQVISGIGFLGAGTILFLKPQIIRGLTTAAGLWSVAGIGLAAGGGMYEAAVIATVIVFCVLALLKPLEKHFIKKNRTAKIYAFFDASLFNLEELEHLLRKNKLSPMEISLRSRHKKNLSDIQISFPSGSDPNAITIFLADLKSAKGITEVSAAYE